MAVVYPKQLQALVLPDERQAAGDRGANTLFPLHPTRAARQLCAAILRSTPAEHHCRGVGGRCCGASAQAKAGLVALCGPRGLPSHCLRDVCVQVRPLPLRVA